MKQATRFEMQPGWKVLISDMGISPADVLKHAGLPADLFARDGTSLSAEQYFDFWRGLEKAAGAVELPLLMGSVISVEAFDAPIYACLCCPDLNTALRRLSHYKRLICPMILDVVIDNSRTTVTVECGGYNKPLPRTFSAMELVFFTQMARMATREHVVPLELVTTELPDNLQPYEDWFGARLQAGDKTRITFSAADARRPFLTENPAMLNFFEPHLKRRLYDLDAKASMFERVKSVLLEILPGGQSAMDEVAARLAVSTRTLQRRLSSEGTSYQQVLKQVREELALYYLKNSSLAAGEISFLLGFHDTNSFIRAFSRWTGKTPGQFRE